MGFWDTYGITPENMNLLGPLVDGIVGTNGEYQDLYEAMVDPAGPLWKKVIVTTGCTMSQDVTLTSGYAGGCIVSPGGVINIGAKKLTIGCDDFMLRNVAIGSTTGDSLVLTEDRTYLHNVSILSSGGIGIKIEVSGGGGNHRIEQCLIYNSAGDGVEIANPSWVTMIGCRIQANGGYGVDDNNASTTFTIFVANIITGNSSGQLDSVSTLVAANKTS